MVVFYNNPYDKLPNGNDHFQVLVPSVSTGERMT